MFSVCIFANSNCLTLRVIYVKLVFFEAIKARVKTVEGRIATVQWKEITPGETVRFKHDYKRVERVVQQVEHFSSYDGKIWIR